MRVGKARRRLARPVLAVFLLLAFGGVAFAVASYLNSFNTRYGTSGTVLNTCGLCHIDPGGGGPTNPFGSDFAANGHNFANIESLDSDGDGFSNLVEINARTFPGDPTSHPAGDAAAPVVTAFAIPATATSLTIPITTFTATDNVGVTGYLITETTTTPSASAAGWSPTPPTSFTFASAGSKTLYAWAKDASGNVSVFRSASTTITLADTSPPVVTNFVIPLTSASLTISITAFTASDDVGVTGYLITETSTKPGPAAAGWSTTAPTSYTFASAGSKTLFAWAKDAAGNVSNSLSASTVVNLNDSTPPQVTAFSIPATSNSLVVPITTFTATDNTAVAGFIITETASVPLASEAGWTTTAPATYTFTTAGSKTLFAWVKDGSGNVSASATASTTITLTDATPPQVTAFSIPSTATALAISITTFTATDNVAVTGYLITETATKPTADPTAGWTATAPTTFTFATAGSKTLYAWAKDAAGNVSSSSTATTVITVSSGEGSGGHGGCFIATAAFGSYLNPYVRTLREFRDTFLLTNSGGRAFVAWYYRNSPPVADVIAQHSLARAIVRTGLLPLIIFSLIALKIGAVPALVALFLCLAGVALGAKRIITGKRALQPVKWE